MSVEKARRQLLLVTVIVEGTLFAVYFAWASVETLPQATLNTLKGQDEIPSGILALPPDYLYQSLLGILACIPLLVVNLLAFGPLARRYNFLKPCREFVENVIRPAVRVLDWRTAAIVAVFAGVGEECFFRGVLLTEIGVIFSSLLFSVVHFPNLNRKQLVVPGIYFLVGLYFAGLKIATQGLFVPIVAHTVYDYVAILYLRYRSRTEDAIT